VPGSALVGVVVVGALIVVADAAYAGATEVGPLGVVAVLGALHTVVTVGLAGAVLGERVGPVQAVGIAAALAGAAVVVAG
jgi:drug/metabolite transporter (DMT)-like permease